MRKTALKQDKVWRSDPERTLIDSYEQMLGINHTEFRRLADRFFIRHVNQSIVLSELRSFAEEYFNTDFVEPIIKSAVADMRKRGFDRKSQEYVLKQFREYALNRLEKGWTQQTKRFDKHVAKIEELTNEMVKHLKEPRVPGAHKKERRWKEGGRDTLRYGPGDKIPPPFRKYDA